MYKFDYHINSCTKSSLLLLGCNYSTLCRLLDINLDRLRINYISKQLEFVAYRYEDTLRRLG